MNFCQMKIEMMCCEQMPGLSVLEHGEMVSDYYKDLVGHLRGQELKHEWRLPEWTNRGIRGAC